MLQIILWILKIIGIILAVLLGAVLVLLFLFLFVPARYKAFAKKGGEWFVDAKVTWLLHLLCLSIVFQENKLSAKLKVLGFTVKDFMADEPKEKPEQSVKPVSEPVTEPPTETAAAQSRKLKSRVIDGKREPVKQQKKEKTILRLGISDKIRNLKYTIRRFCDKIEQILKSIQDFKAFWQDERTSAALRLCFGQAYDLVRKLFPGKVKGEVHFGTEDPALTGEILAGISIFYPVFMDNVRVIPDFEQPCLEGELFVKGKLRTVTLLRIIWELFWDKDIRYVYQTFHTRTNTV